MDEETTQRCACLDLPALPLQLLLRTEPDWVGGPVVVVDEDRPQGRVLWSNALAWSLRVLPGMRYATALSLVSELRAGVVAHEMILRAQEEVVACLRTFSPRVEPSSTHPGTFFLDATGLERLFAGLSPWGLGVLEALRGRALQGHLAVGFTRFGSFVCSRAEGGPPVRVLECADAETKLAGTVGLERLDLVPEMRDALHRLGIRTLGEFLALPPEGLQRRFGTEAVKLHRLARGDLHDPLQPLPPPPVTARRLLCEQPESDSNRLLFLTKRLLDPLLELLAERHEALQEMRMTLVLEGRSRQLHRLRPAEPTLVASLLLDLLRLRLEGVALEAGVVELQLAVRGVRAEPEQIRLFREGPKRDLAAANRALARVRAELGDETVGHMVVREGHLPEATFAFERLERLDKARPVAEAPLRFVRRVLEKPRRLPPVPRHLRDDGWIPFDVAAGSVVKLHGPYVVSGGWWQKEQQREYHYAQTRRGDLLWIYFDRVERRWFLQGWLE
jgi:protein ImuB